MVRINIFVRLTLFFIRKIKGEKKITMQKKTLRETQWIRTWTSENDPSFRADQHAFFEIHT